MIRCGRGRGLVDRGVQVPDIDVDVLGVEEVTLVVAADDATPVAVCSVPRSSLMVV